MKIKKAPSKIAALGAIFALTTATQAATIVYTTDTTLTSAVTDTATANQSNPGFLVRNGATLTMNTGSSLFQPDQAVESLVLKVGTNGTDTNPNESGNFVLNAGTINNSETGGNNVTGITAYSSSVVTINGGAVNVTENGNGPSGSANNDPLNAVGFKAFGNSHFILNGGTFNINELNNGQVTPFTAADNSLVEIFGGLWNYNANPNVFGFNLSGSAQVILDGTFNYASGDIVDSTGTITGTLSNGDAFSMGFDKTLGGTITIIPEPSAALLGGLGLLALLRRRRN